jgi:hypothetical protein
MTLLIKIMCIEVWVFLAGLAAVLVYKILTGRVRLSGLLLGEEGLLTEERLLSVSRVQLIFITLIAALYYMAQVVNNPTQFPEVPDTLLYILGASNVLHLRSRYNALTRNFR